MAGGLQSLDVGFPKFSNNESADQKIDKIVNYLFLLREQLSYTLSNLGAENFNETELNKLLEGRVSFGGGSTKNAGEPEKGEST